MDVFSALRQVTAAIRKWVDDNKVDKVSGKGLSTHDYTTAEKNKLSGIASGAEVNQNAFSNIVVGSATIAADTKTDTLTIAAGNNITIIPDTANDRITIAAADGTYTHPSYTAITGVPTANAAPAFGEAFSVSQPVSDALGHITAINNRTITIPNVVATTSVNGLMSSTDKAKLNGIATGANKTDIDSALSSTSTNPVQNKVVNDAISSLKTLVGTTDVATQINNAVSSKQNTITGAATTITSDNLTADRVLVSDSSGKVAVSDVTSVEVSYLDGVTSNIQTQLNAKSASSHIHTPAEIGALATTGGTLTGTTTIGNSSAAPWLNFATKTGGDCGSIQYYAPSDSTSNHYEIYVRSRSSEDYSLLDFSEIYKLPVVNTDLTSNETYYILTSKSPVSVKQGGTGATDAATALTNLGIIYSETEPDRVAGRIWLKPI